MSDSSKISAQANASPSACSLPSDGNEPLDRNVLEAATRPQPLQNRRRKVFHGVVDGVCMLVCFAIFTFAGLVHRASGKELGPYEKKLIEVARVVRN